MLKLADGRTIHILGLRKWTVGMVQDSLSKYAPGDSLQSHACAATLRYKLGFADASSLTLRMGRDLPDILFVGVREPQDSARVKYRDMPLDTVAPRHDWLPATSLMANPRAYRTVMSTMLAAARAGQRTSAPAGADTLVARAVAFFDARRSDGDYRTAMTVIRSSRNYRDRNAAALILAHFADRPATRVALFEAMRESDGPVKGTALEVLQAVSPRLTGTWNWAELAPSVNAMLDGTSLFLLNDVMQLLGERPDVGPAQAAPFLHDGGEMVITHLSSTEPIMSSRAHALLVKLRGADLGKEPAAWKQWIATL